MTITYPAARSHLIRPTAYFFLLSLLCFAMLLPGELAGWALILSSYLLIYALSDTQNASLLKALLLITTTRHFVSLFNVYVSTTLGAGADAGRFHRSAVQLSYSAFSFFDWRGELGASFYVWLLSKMYMLFGGHQLVGQTASIMAFIGFTILLYRIALLLDLDEKAAVGVVLLFCLFPAAIAYTSIILREAWKLLFLALFVHSFLCYYSDSRIKHLLLSLMACLGLWSFHKGFGALSPVLLFLPVVASIHKIQITQQTNSSYFRMFWLFILLITLGGLSFYLFTANNQYTTTQEIISEGALAAIEQNRATALRVEGRASYGIALDTSSVGGIARSLPLIYVYYLASPFVWQIRTGLDIYAFFDAVIGSLFLLGAVERLKNEKDTDTRIKIGYLLFVFLLVSIVHSLGTINYGTATRHRLLTTWLAFVLGWPIVIPRIRKMLS